MIGKLTGILLEKNPPQLLIDCHGVGYEVDVPMSTFYNLPATGEVVSLLTHFVVREDAQMLYAFGSAPERLAFRQLIKVTGVGPRMALAVLSGLSVADLAQAITRQEVGRLVKVPGVGKKTAERLLLELKGKLGVDLGDMAQGAGSGMPAHTDNQSDIQQALLALGYNDKEAATALSSLPEGVGVSEGIRLALKRLTR
ncbi:MAG: Holliday junction ATP-dependent helicase RuvA [Pseudomonadota bacterium]|jgi:Holliday junction DNA helicase RuvA